MNDSDVDVEYCLESSFVLSEYSNHESGFGALRIISALRR